MQVRRRTYEVFEVAKQGDGLSRACDVLILTLIGVNVIALILGSVKSIYHLCPAAFSVFEVFSVLVFTVEYVLRLWACVEAQRFHAPFRGRLRFAVTPLAVIDLLAILPFYMPVAGLDLRFLRIVRMMRLFRVAEVGRYSRSIQLIQRVVLRKKEPLVCTLCVLFLLLVMAASMMYYAENSAQPEAFSNIPEAMWWAVATLTTVGYGDIYPVTGLGKLMAAAIAILGIGMFALPTGILGAGFVEELENRRTPKQCPHCGREIPR